MSQIFDALNQTEAERSGSRMAGAKELLEIVERKAGHSAPQSEQTVPSVETANQSQFQKARVAIAPQSKLVCILDTESLAAEKFRFLNIRLRHLQQKRSLKRILVTSSVAGEGKSTIAGNLACALAGSKQQRVLLVEGDLRRPSLSKQLGLEGLPGLSDLLETDAKASKYIYQLESLGLWILPCGTPLSNPLEFMQPAKLGALMDELSASFDWILVDSPPVLPFADTSIWMRLADGILLVTRPGTTAKRQLQRSLETIEQSKLIGAIMNGSKEATNNNYKYYSTRVVPLQPADSSARPVVSIQS